MNSTRSVVFVNPVRTAIGTFGGSLQEVAAPDLGAAAIRAAIGRAGLKPDDVDSVFMGNVIQAGVKMNPARQAAIHAGLPVTVPAMTVNRVCGSGAQAVVSAAQEILLGTMDVAVAGGMEIIPIDVSGRKGPIIFDRDEHNRPKTTVEALAALKPAFRTDGTITAGNAPGINSGAAALVLTDRQWAEAHGLAPVATLISYGIAAVEPGMFGLAPIPAVRQALARAGWQLGDIERIEINEAFAAIVIAVARELGLPGDIVNVEGGAIAHGHPIGATGAVLLTRLIHSMQRDGLRRGIVTLCIGGGQGIALAIEMVS